MLCLLFYASVKAACDTTLHDSHYSLFTSSRITIKGDSWFSGILNSKEITNTGSSLNVGKAIPLNLPVLITNHLNWPRINAKVDLNGHSFSVAASTASSRTKLSDSLMLFSDLLNKKASFQDFYYYPYKASIVNSVRGIPPNRILHF